MPEFFENRHHDSNPHQADEVRYVLTQDAFARLLGFTGWTIEDLRSNPIAQLDFANWCRIDRQMNRLLEVHELEKQWNRLR